MAFPETVAHNAHQHIECRLILTLSGQNAWLKAVEQRRHDTNSGSKRAECNAIRASELLILGDAT
jgi:hypothetical protein